VSSPLHNGDADRQAISNSIRRRHTNDRCSQLSDCGESEWYCLCSFSHSFHTFGSLGTGVESQHERRNIRDSTVATA